MDRRFVRGEMLHGSSGRGLGYLPEAILACRDLQPRIALLWALSCSTNAEGSPPASKSAGSHSQWEGDDYNDGLVIPRERAEAAVLLAIPSLLSCMLHERVALGEVGSMDFLCALCVCSTCMFAIY